MGDSEKWRTKAELQLMFGKSERTIRRAIADIREQTPDLVRREKGGHVEVSPEAIRAGAFGRTRAELLETIDLQQREISAVNDDNERMRRERLEAQVELLLRENETLRSERDRAFDHLAGYMADRQQMPSPRD